MTCREKKFRKKGENDGITTPILSKSWTKYVGRHKQFSFTGTEGLLKDLPQDITPLEFFF